MPSLAGLYALWAWLFVALGLSIAVLGPAIPALRLGFSVTLSGAGLIFSLHSLGYFFGVFAAGAIADQRGRRFVTAAGAAGLAGGMTLAAGAPSWMVFLGAMALAGVGFAFVDVGLNAAIGDAENDPRRRAAAMNLLHGAFPLGTLAAPAGLALAWQLGLDWRAAFLITAVATAAGIVPLVVRRARWPRRSGESTGTAPPPVVAVLNLLREPHLASLAAVQGLYVGVELGIAGWLATYLVETFAAPEGMGALVTSFYWGGFLIGRPVIAYLTHRFEPGAVLFWLIGAALLTAIAGVFAPSPAAAAGAYLATGLSICGVFPTVMALALQGRRGDAGAVTALITAAASIGGLTWPWLVGMVAEYAGMRVAMATAAAPLLVMLPLARAGRTAPTVIEARH